MRNSPWYLHVTVIALAVFWPALARADRPASATVTGHGTAELQKQAEYLRIHVEILAKGRDPREALTKLREKRQNAQSFLQGLGVSAPGISFSDPAVTSENDEAQRHRAMFIRHMMRNQGKKPEAKPKAPPPVMVACTLKAEIRLKAPNAEELLVLAHTLEGQLRAADLGGMRDLKQATPQDEELAQEAQEEMIDMNEGNMPKRGEPLFLYVCKVSDEEQSQVLAQAFQKARREAAQLARAAAADLGPLYHLDGNSPEGFNAADLISGENPNSYQVLQQLLIDRDRPVGSKQSGEAVGLQPGKVTFRVVLSAAFELKTASR
jgi:hypothetical protein